HRGNGVGIYAQLDDRRLARLGGTLIGRREVLGPLHRFTIAAERARIRGEVWIFQLGAIHAPRIFALLVHADRAVEAVVHHHRDKIRAVLRGGGDLLTGHEEVAVAA